MTSMVEKVARAICIDDCRDPDLVIDPKGELAWMHYVTAARAAIQAMKEADLDMYHAAHDNGVDLNQAVVCYEAMIDAALKEE